MEAELLLVAALREEAAPLVRRLRERCRLAGFGIPTWSGRLGGRSAWVAVTGDGQERAGRCLARLLATHRPRACLLVGVAGALSPGLEVGDLVSAERVWDLEAGEAVGAPDSGSAVPGARSGLFASGRRVLWRSGQKRELWDALGRPAVAVVDTESAAWARAAASRGVPWRALRAVSDTAAEHLPLDFDRLRGADGRVSRSRVAARALRAPAAIPGLLRLRARVARGAEGLAESLERTLRW